MDGERQVQGAGKGEGVRGCRLPSPPVFLKISYAFLLSVWMKEVASELPFYMLTYMNFNLFPFIHVLVKDVFNIQHLTHLTLSLADVQEPYCHHHTKGKVKEGKTRKEGGARV